MDAGKGKQETGDERRENEMRDGRRVPGWGEKEEKLRVVRKMRRGEW